MNCQNTISSFLKLLNSDGLNKNDWTNLLNNIQKEDNIKTFIDNVQTELDKKINNELLIDIIDFLFDFSFEKTINFISEEIFLESFLSLLKKGNEGNTQIQIKIIYLIQKWAIKDNRNNSNIKIKYDFLKNNGIVFPQCDYKMKTYDKYIDKDEFTRIFIDNDNKNSNLNNNNDRNNNNDNENNIENNYESQVDNIKKNNLKTTNELNLNKTMINNENNNQVQENNIYINQRNFNFEKGSDFRINVENNNNLFKNYIQIKPYEEEKKNSKNKKNENNDNTFLTGEILNHPEKIKNIWEIKIDKYNKYIDEGKLSNNIIKLKEGINEIIDNLLPMENLITKFTMLNNNKGSDDMITIKNDMEQTLYRYNQLMKNKKVEPFISAFNGNKRKYNLNENLILQEDNNISNYDYSISIERIKNNLINFGSNIKEKSIESYGYIKEKFYGDNNNNNYERYNYYLNNNNISKNDNFNNNQNNNNNQQHISNYNEINTNNNTDYNNNEGILDSVKSKLYKFGNSISDVFKNYNFK